MYYIRIMIECYILLYVNNKLLFKNIMKPIATCKRRI